MSAFVVDPAHCKVLALYAVDLARHCSGSRRVDPRYLTREWPHVAEWIADPDDWESVASHYADALWQENIRSVRHRYPTDAWDALPGPCEKPETISISSSDAWYLTPQIPSAVAILKLCACLAYQSCETPDWESTFAFALLAQIKEAAIRELDGYDDAPWEFDDPRVLQGGAK